MPDWSYRPLFAPWMLRAPAFSQALVLMKMRWIGDSPLLFRIIDLMGHMRPPKVLRRSLAGVDLGSPLGMSAVIDPQGKALRAFERFGYGYLELGPVAPARPTGTVDRSDRSLIGSGSVEAEQLLRNLTRFKSRLGAKRFVRVAAGDDGSTFTKLASQVDAFIAPRSLATSARASGRPWGLICALQDAETLSDVDGAQFLVVDPDTDAWSPRDLDRGKQAVASLRRRFPDLPLVYAAGGIEAPGDALALLDAGATTVNLSHGFVFTGPGTPKRINEALSRAAEAEDAEGDEPASMIEWARFAWFWCTLQGAAMALGALLAGYFALTRVILPYDEAATGVTRDAILALNPKVLSFMAHDRFTLAGTMLSLGILYASLGWNGVRRGLDWAQEAVVFSAFAGFLTFFAFLTYGYFDQFHAFVAASMLPIAVQCAAGRATKRSPAPRPDLLNDQAWRHSTIGQLCFVIEAIGLLLAGIVITLVGGSYVFVETDIAFLGTSGEALLKAYPLLVPLIAHDRVTFGGMLFASGIAVLLTALWGMRRGERWLWKTLAFAGYPAYFATLWIHQDIAYTDPLHLSPVFIGLALHTLGLASTRKFLY